MDEAVCHESDDESTHNKSTRNNTRADPLYDEWRRQTDDEVLTEARPLGAVLEAAHRIEPKPPRTDKDAAAIALDVPPQQPP